MDMGEKKMKTPNNLAAQRIYESLVNFEKIKKSKDGKYPRIRCTESLRGNIYYIEISKNKDLKYFGYTYYSLIYPSKMDWIRFYEVVERRKPTWKERWKGITFEKRCEMQETSLKYMIELLLMMPQVEKKLLSTKYLDVNAK